MSWMKFAKMGKDMLGGQGGGDQYGAQMDLGMSQMQPQGLMSFEGMMDESMTSPQSKPNIGLFDDAGAPTEDTMGVWGDAEQPSMADQSSDFSASNEGGDGMFGWLQKKYPEMADMGTAESLAFLKQKGVIGSGKYHGAAQANQLGMSQSQGANMMTGMDGLMKQAMSGGARPAKQIQLGLMGGGQPQQNPWGLMGG